MLLDYNLRCTTSIFATSKTKVVFNKDIEFCVAVSTKDNLNYVMQIEEIKGNFTKLFIGSTIKPHLFSIDPPALKFFTNANELQHPFTFYAQTIGEFKKVQWSVWYQEIKISLESLQFLNPFEYYQNSFTLKDYEFYKIQYFVKKTDANCAEINVKNPYKFLINGQKNDYNYFANGTNDVILKITISYDPDVMQILNQNAKDGLEEFDKVEKESESFICVEDQSEYSNKPTEATLIPDQEIPEVSNLAETDAAQKHVAVVEVSPEIHVDSDSSKKFPYTEAEPKNHLSSDQDDAIPTMIITDKPSESAKTSTTKSQNMLTATNINNNDYVILISSDGKRIFSSSSLLTRNSYIFATIFKKNQNSPIKINIEEFNAEIIYAALDFLNGKDDAVKGKELELYRFADKYSLLNLKDACSLKFDKILCPENVVEVIKVAYANYFEELKQKCIKMMTDKKFVGSFEDLPTEIVDDLSDAMNRSKFV